MCLIFEFDGESMTNEKVYFDLNTPLRQLGIADDYNSLRGKLSAGLGHPIVILKALIFSLTHRAEPGKARPFMIAKYVITIAYSALLAGGVFVGVRQIYHPNRGSRANATPAAGRSAPKLLLQEVNV